MLFCGVDLSSLCCAWCAVHGVLFTWVNLSVAKQQSAIVFAAPRAFMFLTLGLPFQKCCSGMLPRHRVCLGAEFAPFLFACYRSLVSSHLLSDSLLYVHCRYSH